MSHQVNKLLETNALTITLLLGDVQCKTRQKLFFFFLKKSIGKSKQGALHWRVLLCTTPDVEKADTSLILQILMVLHTGQTNGEKPI